MRSYLLASVLILLLASFGIYSHATQMVGSPTPSPLPSVVPSPTPSLEAGFTFKEFLKVRSEFERSLATEMKALKHRQSKELKELDRAQDARYKSWKKSETAARRTFFTENPKGTDRRKYIQGVKNRRESLLREMKEERKTKLAGHEEARLTLQDEHRERRKEFESYLAQGKRPPDSVWTKPGF